MSATHELSRKPTVALIGGGLHAVVVAECIRAVNNARIAGYVDQSSHDTVPMRLANVPCLGDDDRLIDLINMGRIDATVLAVAGCEHAELRRRLVARFSEHS